MPFDGFFRQFLAKGYDTPTPSEVPLQGTYKRRDRRAEALRIVSKWRRLDQLDPESHDYPPLLNSFLDDKVDRKATTSLEDEDAIVVLDILAKILERVRNLEHLSNHVLRVFQSLAYKAGQVPNCYKIDRNLDFQIDPVAFASGGFSDVRKGHLGGQVVAVKVLRMAQNSNVVKLQKDFCKEAVLWKSISHPNVLGLIAVDIDGSTGRCFMVSELMGNGNIFEFIQRNSANRLRLLADVAEGLYYLHRLNIFHGDIKGPNILITNATPPQACLSDFGFSIPAPTNTFPLSTCGMNLGGGTPPYMAPELIRPSMFGLSGSEASREGDIFAFGMAMYEVVTGVRPFSLEGKRVQELIFAVTEGERPKKPENAEAIGFGNGIWNLVEKCWSQDRKQRPSTRDVRLRLTFAASTSSSAPPGPRVAVSQARTVSTRSRLFTSYVNLFKGKSARTDPDASSGEGGDQHIRLISLDHPKVERSISVAKEVVSGIHASISPTARRGFELLERLPFRRFMDNVRVKLNFGSSRLRRD